MSIRTEDVYRSSNGDRWQLLFDSSNQKTVVRHLPNASSGGAVSEARLPQKISCGSVAQGRNLMRSGAPSPFGRLPCPRAGLPNCFGFRGPSVQSQPIGTANAGACCCP